MPVFIVNEENKNAFTQAVLDYLHGCSVQETKQKITAACQNNGDTIGAKQFCQVLRFSPASPDLLLNKKFSSIYSHLQLEPQESNNGSLYDILRNRQLDNLIEIIDNIHPDTPLIYFIYPPAILTLGILGFSYLQPQFFWSVVDWLIDSFPEIYHWINQYAIQMNHWPVIGMGLQVFWLAYYLYDTVKNGWDPSNQKIFSLLFRIAALTLSFIGHMLTFWAGGVLYWGPALCFIASSVVNIIENISFFLTPSEPDLEDNASEHTKAFYHRQRVKHSRNYEILVAKLIYAIVMTILLVISTLLPPNLFLTMFYTLSLALAFLIRDHAIQEITKKSADDEQSQVKDSYQVSDKEQFFQESTNKYLSGNHHNRSDRISKQISEIANAENFEIKQARKDIDLFMQGFVNGSPSPDRGSHRRNDDDHDDSQKNSPSSPDRTEISDQVFFTPNSTSF